ncbi:hypothetical protein HII31_04417 [Pseudocercospora fuligena]|uniref:Uncharacterized protein n=1 Tax=Pseudocercospora fuligena TaxID=685502 RepID=A0A8H6VPH4_9PEZI|nr:hypothetical protein HII31_04417 [Pseudocercospora fuligena]
MFVQGPKVGVSASFRLVRSAQQNPEIHAQCLSMEGTARLTVHRANQRIASAAKTAFMLYRFVTPRELGWLCLRAPAGRGSGVDALRHRLKLRMCQGIILCRSVWDADAGSPLSSAIVPPLSI